MVVVTPISIPPFSAASSSVAELVRQWERGAGEAEAQSAQARTATAAAKSAGAGVVGEAAGIGTNASQAAAGVGEAKPGPEADLAWRATQNIPGVSTAIGSAEQTSGDPRTDTPNPNTGSAEARVKGKAGNIESRGREVSRRAGEADDLERRI